MFGFIRTIFFTAMTCFSYNALKCVLTNNQECRIIPEIVNISNNEPSFYPCGITVNNCSGSYNNINDPYAKLCIPEVVENINGKVFNLRTNRIV